MSFLLRSFFLIVSNPLFVYANLAAIGFMWWHGRFDLPLIVLHVSVLGIVAFLAHHGLAFIRNRESARLYRATTRTRLLPVPVITSTIGPPTKPLRQGYEAMITRLPAELLAMLAQGVAAHRTSPQDGPSAQPGGRKQPSRKPPPVIVSRIRRPKPDPSDPPVLIERLPAYLNRYVTEGFIRLHTEAASQP